MVLILVYSKLLYLYVQTLCKHLLQLTRENNFKLVHQHCKYDLRKYYFTKSCPSMEQLT